MLLETLLTKLAMQFTLVRCDQVPAQVITRVQVEGEAVANTLQVKPCRSQLQICAQDQVVATLPDLAKDGTALLKFLTVCGTLLAQPHEADPVLPLAIAATTADFQVTLMQAAGMLGNPLGVLQLDGQKFLRVTNDCLRPDSEIGQFLASHVPAIDPEQFYQHLYVTTPEQSPTPLLLTPLSYHNDALGYLAMAITATPLMPKHLTLLPKLGQLIAHVAVAQRVIEKHLSARDQLVNLLLDSPVDATWAAQFRLQHAQLPHAAVIVQAIPTMDRDLGELRERLSYLAAPMFDQVLITLAHQKCLALISVSLKAYNSPHFHAKLAKLAAQAQCRLIVSHFYSDPSMTKPAAAVCEKAAQLDRQQAVMFCEDVAFELMLAQVQDGDTILPFFIGPALQALAHYDDEMHSELVKTLQAYLAATCNQVETASALFIHPNTLRNRLQRIQELTGLDLKDAQTCFKLAASYKVSAYLKAQQL